MKHIASITCLVVGIVWLAITAPPAFAESSQQSSAPIPMDQLGAVAGKQYQGDGLSVIATPDGARLRCAFQRLEGQVTREGLLLSSTADNNSGERFRVMAIEVGRVTPCAPAEDIGFDFLKPLTRPSTTLSPSDGERDGVRGLPRSGLVTVTDNMARFIRPGLTEEYTVSVDGVRQDFIIEQRPEGDGELRVELDVTGAKAEPLVNGVCLVLDGSGRKLAYNRLRVTDATGRELPARMEVTADRSDLGRAGSPLPADGAHGVTRPTLAVLVDDATAIYPVRIDPTFSDADWVSMGGFPGASDEVFAAAVDGSGNLIIGGSFTIVGNTLANRIAKWDGNTWSAFGAGLNQKVSSLAIMGSDVFAGGQFSTAGGATANGIAKWNGTSWSPLGTNLIVSDVYTLAVSGTNLYAGGFFWSSIDTNIARWDGNTWHGLGTGIIDGSLGGASTVKALAVDGTNLFVGGNFTNAGGITVNRIAKWDGNTWSALGAGVNGIVESVAVSGTNLYVGGDFWMAGEIVAYRIAKWDGNTWSALGQGMNSNVTSLVVIGNDLYAGGKFTPQNSQLAYRIAKWDGVSWSPLGVGVGGAFSTGVNVLVSNGAGLYVGGKFSTAGGTNQIAYNLAQWSAGAWSLIGSRFGAYGTVKALAISGTNLYVGGAFTRTDATNVNYIAKWDGNGWSALSSGMNDWVYGLATMGTNLYAVGSFTSAGGNFACDYIGKWDGFSWSSLTVPVGNYPPNDIINAVVVSGTNLYVGGRFYFGAGPNNHVGRWNGNAWSSLGSGIGGGNSANVYALAVSGTNLFVGGAFTNAGGVAATNIAKWNGSTWSSVGSGLNSTVYALAVSGTNLYAGGEFTKAGGSNITHIARWNGNAWSPVGGGINVAGGANRVRALAVLGNDLYVGGYFSRVTNVGGAFTFANSVAKWDGTTWSALGSGIGGEVHSLAVDNTNLFVGGGFGNAGDKVSWSVARAIINTIPVPGRFTGPVYSETTGFSCTFLDASVGQPYRIQTSPTLAAGSWTDFTNFTYTAPVVITVPVAGNTNRFFRAITP